MAQQPRQVFVLSTTGIVPALPKPAECRLPAECASPKQETLETKRVFEIEVNIFGAGKRSAKMFVLRNFDPHAVKSRRELENFVRDNFQLELGKRSGHYRLGVYEKKHKSLDEK